MQRAPEPGLDLHQDLAAKLVTEQFLQRREIVDADRQLYARSGSCRRFAGKLRFLRSVHATTQSRFDVYAVSIDLLGCPEDQVKGGRMSERRCDWCGEDPLYVEYHDTEWGRPDTDSRTLFEKLILDGFQAGLSWITILRKRPAFRAGFDGFDPEKIARYDESDVERLLADAGIVRHRGKIEATIGNARAFLKIEEREGFNRFLWKFYDFKPLQNQFETMADVPAATAVSKEMSKALKAEGFKFCGPTIVYAFSQACGLVNDHMVGCTVRDACAAEAAGVRF